MLSVVNWTTISIHRCAFTAFLSLFCSQISLALLMCAWTNRARLLPNSLQFHLFSILAFSNTVYQWLATSIRFRQNVQLQNTHCFRILSYMMGMNESRSFNLCWLNETVSFMIEDFFCCHSVNRFTHISKKWQIANNFIWFHSQQHPHWIQFNSSE